ncbi:hypothetical protein NRA64_18575, partial [Acinetobacter baumannii]|nr:hypothetical protein [Acinetobacter baumannii]
QGRLQILYKTKELWRLKEMSGNRLFPDISMHCTVPGMLLGPQEIVDSAHGGVSDGAVQHGTFGDCQVTPP